MISLWIKTYSWIQRAENFVLWLSGQSIELSVLLLDFMSTAGIVM